MKKHLPALLSILLPALLIGSAVLLINSGNHPDTGESEVSKQFPGAVCFVLGVFFAPFTYTLFEKK